jgi:hypothetical protein
LRFWGLGLGGGGLGFRFWGLVCGVAGCGLRVAGCGLRVAGCGLRDSALGSRVPGFGFLGSGFGFWVSGFGSRVLGLGDLRDRRDGPTNESRDAERVVLIHDLDLPRVVLVCLHRDVMHQLDGTCRDEDFLPFRTLFICPESCQVHLTLIMWRFG